MALPSFSSFWLPFLRVLAERGRTSLKEVKADLPERLGLTDADVRVLLPSGKQRRYDNRVGWTSTYLSKAGLINTVERGVYELTQDGRDLLATKPDRIDHDDLRRYPTFRAWEEASRSSSTGSKPSDRGGHVISDADGETPEEAMAAAFSVMQENLASDVEESLQGVTWQRFEDIVIDVLLALGYGGSRSDAGRAFKASGDGGVDGVIDEDRLGLSKILVQAKRYAPDRRISRPDVQSFVGSLLGMKSRQGIFITTSDFSNEARGYVEGLAELRVILIDGRMLAHLMIEHGVGVTEQDRYVIKRVDRDYFDEA